MWTFYTEEKRQKGEKTDTQRREADKAWTKWGVKLEGEE